MKSEFAVNAASHIQLTVRAPSSPDLVARVLETVRTRGNGVRTYCAFQSQNHTVMMIVPGDVRRAALALESIGHRCQSTPVVVVTMPYRVGVVAQLGGTLATAGVRTLYSYASFGNDEELVAVFKTIDDERALEVLGASALARAA